MLTDHLYIGCSYSPRKIQNRRLIVDDKLLLIEALHFAADKHRDQRRKDVHASPYINHPIAVAQILAAVGSVDDADVLAAALLHDTIEDTFTEESELEEKFGNRIARIVQEVTDDSTLTRSERKRLQIEHARTISPDAALVKLADKTANIRDIAHNPPNGWDLQRREEYLAWAAEVVSNLPPVNADLEAQFAESLTQARGALNR